MIKDQESFQAALQRVADLLEHPPAHGTPADQEFAELLHDIEHFAPRALTAPPVAADSTITQIGRQAETLLSRANDFQAKREAREKQEKWTSFPEDGQGIGPTTGV